MAQGAKAKSLPAGQAGAPGSQRSSARSVLRALASYPHRLKRRDFSAGDEKVGVSLILNVTHLRIVGDKPKTLGRQNVRAFFVAREKNSRHVRRRRARRKAGPRDRGKSRSRAPDRHPLEFGDLPQLARRWWSEAPVSRG